MALEKKNFSILLQEVVDPAYCCGCGVCVGVCNDNAIAIQTNSRGQYEPFYSDESSCTSCSLCTDVCPFKNSNPDENELGNRKFGEIEQIKHMPETGYYLETRVGAADEKTRLNGSSGGALSHLLKWLLENDLVDKIITVEGTDSPEKLFGYTIINTLEDVDRCARSAYYPVELSKVLSEILNSENIRYAVVGLPCVLKAVELAKVRFPRLNRNIHFTLGLVCGQLKSKKYAEYLIQDLGVEMTDVQNVFFRKKLEGYSSSNMAFEVTTKTGEHRQRMFIQGVNTIWSNDLFKMNSCYHCDDVFAECADASFMDAWLPEYMQDYKGTSLIVNRNKTLQKFFAEGGFYKPISIDKVIKSQKGVLIIKRSYIHLYEKLALRMSSIVPSKRSFKKVFKNRVSISTKKQKMRYKWSHKIHKLDFREQQAYVANVTKILAKIDYVIKIELKLRNMYLKIRRRLFT